MTFLKTPEFSKTLQKVNFFIGFHIEKSDFLEEKSWFSKILGLSKMSSKNFQKKSHRKKNLYFFIFVLCLNIIPNKFQGATPHIGEPDVLFVLDPPDFGEV